MSTSGQPAALELRLPKSHTVQSEDQKEASTQRTEQSAGRRRFCRASTAAWISAPGDILTSSTDCSACAMLWAPEVSGGAAGAATAASCGKPKSQSQQEQAPNPGRSITLNGAT
mmetsp:Transcript_15386/g.27491  ORF Transcript_15386/g.27491 Transcript_15386/m.27491 type:complete len:114 (-) Transcript_15386:1314-1655(-)